MATTTSARPLVNPLLRDAERVSPAQALDLVVDFDSDGWEIRRTFAVGQIVVSLSDHLYKVIGFSLDNEVFVQPYGLGHDPAVRWMTFQPAGLRVTELPLCGDTDEQV